MSVPGAAARVGLRRGVRAGTSPDVDPLKYNLVFERLLNPERISMPDIDIDFDYERRGEVIGYVARKYGEDHVAQIITFGTMAARAVIRDVGRAIDLSYQETDTVAKMVPFEIGHDARTRAYDLSPELKRSYEGDGNVKRLIDTARKARGHAPARVPRMRRAYSSRQSLWMSMCQFKPTTT